MSIGSSQRKSVAAVILTYFPEAEVVSNALVILQQVDKVFLVNNQFGDHSQMVLAPLSGDERVEFVNLDENLGVAAGFNRGMERALLEGFEYVIIFDQDSRPTEGMVFRLIEVQKNFGEPVGIVGPALRDLKSGRLFRKEVGIGAVPREILISSGSLFHRKLVDEVGLHDESLFIDYVDHEICLRSSQKGKINLKVFDAVLDHQFGESEQRRFFGRTVFVSNYSPLRHYYMSRNRILVFDKYGFGSWLGEDLGYVLKTWIKVILYERGRKLKIVAFLRGAWDGVWGKVE